MRRSPWIRLITTVWAFWFAAILAQPAPLMAFLMRATMGTRATAVSVADSPAGPAMPDMAGKPCDGATHHAPPTDSSCMHLGACCCTPVLTVPIDVAADIAAAPIRLVRATIPSNVAFIRPTAPAHAHPFSIGPPVSFA